MYWSFAHKYRLFAIAKILTMCGGGSAGRNSLWMLYSDSK